MILLISLALAELLLLLCVKLLKKYPGIFYGTAALFSAVVTGLYWAAPDGLSPVLLNKFPLWLGALGTSCFIEVMSVGALPNGHGRMKKVMPIRGELSIFACLLTLGQNLSYGKNYLMPGYLLSGPVSAVKTAAWFSIVMIVLMLVLTVTSIKAVRRRFSPKRWKAVQRWAYLFYGLIYIHVLLMNIPGFLKGRGGCGLTLAAYSVVFFSYALCRVRKAILLHKGQASRVTNRSQMAGAAAGTALSLLFVAGLHFSIPGAVPVPAAPQVSELLSQEPNEAAAEPELELDLEKESVSPSAMDKTSADAPEPDEQETAEPASEPLPEPPPEIESEPEPEPMLEPSFKYQNGTFTGTGEGYYGPVTVSVTISQDVVTSIVINNCLDDEDYFSDAEKVVIPTILSGQSPEVSAVSGATYSSKGIMAAVRDALAKAEN